MYYMSRTVISRLVVIVLGCVLAGCAAKDEVSELVIPGEWSVEFNDIETNRSSSMALLNENGQGIIYTDGRYQTDMAWQYENNNFHIDVTRILARNNYKHPWAEYSYPDKALDYEAHFLYDNSVMILKREPDDDFSLYVLFKDGVAKSNDKKSIRGTWADPDTQIVLVIDKKKIAISSGVRGARLRQTGYYTYKDGYINIDLDQPTMYINNPIIPFIPADDEAFGVVLGKTCHFNKQPD